MDQYTGHLIPFEYSREDVDEYDGVYTLDFAFLYPTNINVTFTIPLIPDTEVESECEL